MRKSLRALSLSLLLILSFAAWSAETAVLRQRAELKSEQYIDAATINTLEKDTRVEIIRRQGGWVLVQAGKRQGWLRAETLALSSSATAAPVAGVLAMDNGRAGRSDLIATTGVRAIEKPSSQQIHALIMTVGAYEEGIPPLKGVKYDAENARAIALRMGIPESNIMVFRDQELTLDGMRRAFDGLESRLQENDQVFIYYSGHGGRQRVVEPTTGERCAESMITVDGQYFLDSDVEARLKRMSTKARKLVMFLDACHSGGVTTRAIGAVSNSAEPAYTPKYWYGKGVATDACPKPANVLTRSINMAAKSPGSGGANYVYIAAAKDNEISLDQPGRGGVASQAWLACMAGAAKDLDGSGGLSAEEIRTCAQERIDQQLRNVPGFLPHHVSITGNSNMVLSYVGKGDTGTMPAVAANTVAVPAPSTPTIPVPTPTVSSVPTTPPVAAPQPIRNASPIAALNDIYNSRDDRRLVTLNTSKPALRIGQDNVEFTLSSREGGYIYLLMVGTDGNSFDLIFPNQLDRNNLIRPGETLQLPRASWQLVPQGPIGKDTILAIVTDAPRDFSKVGLKPVGPFSLIDAVAAKDIQLVTANSENAGSDECSNARKTRDLAVQRRCSTAYGAALLTIEERDK